MSFDEPSNQVSNVKNSEKSNKSNGTHVENLALLDSEVLDIMLAEVQLKTANLNTYFSILRSRLDAVLHNETADPSLIIPTRTTISTGSALLPSLTTREEVEEFKMKALAELGFDYIPQVLAEFQEGE